MADEGDLQPILDGKRLPALRPLGLGNSPIQDNIAAAVASAPVVTRLRTLRPRLRSTVPWGWRGR